MTWFAPRDPEPARRWLRVVLLACALAPLVSAPLFLTSPGRVAVVGIGSGLCALGAAAMWWRWVPGGRSWALAMVGTCALAVWCDLVTEDASATGLVYFIIFPVLAAAHVDRRGAWATAGLSAAGTAVVAAAVLPPLDAVATWGTVNAVVVLLTALLTRTTERSAALLQELRQLVAVDPVTGLFTRRVLDEAVVTAVAATTSSWAHADPAAAPRGCALLLVDVDGLGALVDEHGHLAGDQALRHVGHHLLVVARRLDEGGGAPSVVSRLDGDELAALLPDCTPEEAAAAARDVVESVRAHPLVLPDGARVALTASAGAAHSPTDAAHLPGLHRAADAALHAARRAGLSRASAPRRRR